VRATRAPLLMDMTDFDRLPPDQSAVLSLVLDRGKSYGQVADMLAIPEAAVRDRAHAALDALARASGSSAPVGAPPPRERTPRHDTLRPGDGPRSPDDPPAHDTLLPREGTTPHENPAPHRTPSPPQREARGPLGSPSSRRGGALLLGGIVAVVVVVVVLLSSGGGKGSSGHSSTATTTQSGSTTSPTSTAKPSLNKTIALTPLEPSLKAAGTAYVLSQSNRRAFYVAARGLPPSSGFFYAVWLYNSPSSSAPLGRAPTVGSDGRMEGGGPLPTNAGLYHQMIITKETSTHPKHPGAILLRGTFGLH
jgi:Sigma-70, region 4